MTLLCTNIVILYFRQKDWIFDNLYSVKITIVHGVRLTLYEGVSVSSLKSVLSILTGVHIKQAKVSENIWAFLHDKHNRL